MKSKYKIIIISLLFTSILYACSKSKDASNSTTTSNQLAISSIGTSTEDSQAYWCAAGGHNVAKGENGYYLLSDNANYIFYFDSELKTCIPLCGKADCKHNDNTCNAFLESGTHILNTIYYYKGYVYLLKRTNGNAVLERVNPDGSGRQEICSIAPNEGRSSIKLVFHDESVFVFDGDHMNMNAEYTEKIERISFDGTSRETIFEYTGTNAKIYQGKSYGNKLFFIIDTLSMDENKTANFHGLGLYYYDYTSKETGKVIDESISDYSMDEKNNIIYYYVDFDGLYKMDLTTKEKNKIYNADQDSGTIQLSYDGKYLYLSNYRWSQLNSIKKISQKIWVLDSNTGKIINTIPCDGILQQYFGDQQFLFANKIRNTADGNMAYIDKSDIENVKEWSWLNNNYNK